MEDKKNILLVILILIVLLSSSMVMGVSELGFFKTNSDINLIQTCSNCSYNNITSVISPSSQILITNQNMTKNNTNFLYVLNQNYTSEEGKYLVNGVGDYNGINTIWAYSFEVNPSGKDLTTNQNLVAHSLSVILIILLFVGIALFGFKKLIKHENQVDKYSLSLVILGGGMAIFQALYLLFVTASRESGYLITDILNTNFNIILMVTLGIVLYSLFVIVVKLVNFEEVVDEDNDKESQEYSKKW